MKVGLAEFLSAHSGGKKSASKLILVGRIQVFVVVRAGMPVTSLAVSLGLSVATTRSVGALPSEASSRASGPLYDSDLSFPLSLTSRSRFRRLGLPR